MSIPEKVNDFTNNQITLVILILQKDELKLNQSKTTNDAHAVISKVL